jgi:hypothetical protein
VLPFLAHLPRPERVAFVRNIMRFPLLAILLVYAYLPFFGASAHPFGPLITTPPGPWAGMIGAAGCALGLVVYTLLPFFRRQPLRTVLGDIHFYGAALACMGLFFGLFRSGSDAIFIRDPELVARFATFVQLRAAAGWLLCATAVLPALALFTASPARRTPSGRTGAPASTQG